MGGDPEPLGEPTVAPEVAEALIVRALLAVAYRCGGSPTLDAFDSELAAMERERAAQGLPPLGFPSSRTIVARHDSWVKALAAAGLEPPKTYTRERGLSIVATVDACVDEWGILPGHELFRRWSRACDLSVELPRRPWETVIAEVRRVRSARGDETPAQVTFRMNDMPPLPTPEQAAAIKARLGGPTRPIRGRTAERAYESLRIYAAEHVAPGERASQRHYMAACRKDRRLLWPSGLTRATGRTLTDLFREAGL